MAINKKPTLLLHTCCSPCLTSVFEQLKDDFDVTIFWFNPNIYPKDEYAKRLIEVKRYAKVIGLKLINIEKYEIESFSWNQLVKNQADEPEGGKRCQLCIKYRLLNTANYAAENKYDYFATTLSVSPHKNTKMINDLGREIETKLNTTVPCITTPSLREVRLTTKQSIQKIATLQDNIARNDKVKFLDRDFKKNNGYMRSIELCKKFNIYRQKYCGCQYSAKNF